MRDIKVAVYCIAKNEAAHIARWAESAADADVLLLADTGSNDDTVDISTTCGIRTERICISPWRFDDARNAALALVPADIDLCIALDADEVLVEGWRKHLEALPPTVTRPRYRYTWSWHDGSPGLQYMGDKIHARHGYRWRHPVHEVVTPVGNEIQGECDLEIHHYPDSGKGRSYLPLLELAVREDPTDDRNAHYLARELFFQGQRARAVYEFRRHLDLPKSVWRPERARSMRYLAQLVPDEEETWLLRACAEAPELRDTWFDLTLFYYRSRQWGQCYAAAKRCLSIESRQLVYLSEAEPWGAQPWDYAAISAFRLGRKEEAVELGTRALQLAPDDERLQENLKWYSGALE